MGIFFTKPIQELKISDKNGNNMINDEDDVNPVIPEDTDDNADDNVGDEDNPVIPEDTDDNGDEDNPTLPEDNNDNEDDNAGDEDNPALPEDTDDNTGEENGEDNPALPEDTDDTNLDGPSNPDDVSDNDDDPNGQSEDDDNSDSTPELDDDIISMEKEIFNNLTDEDMAIKNKELKNNYLKLFDSTTSIIDRINNISRTEQNSTILNFSAARITELRQYILDYTTNIYTRRSYIENAINFNQYLAVLSGIKQLLDQIPTIENDLK